MTIDATFTRPVTAEVRKATGKEPAQRVMITLERAARVTRVLRGRCECRAGVARDKLTVAQGADTLVRGELDGNHTRCRVCGSLLFSVVVADRPHVTLGLRVDEPSPKPTTHIFVRSKAPWHAILDDLPQHEEYG